MEANGSKVTSTYVPYSRGMIPYLGVYSPRAIVLYNLLLLKADWRPGATHGQVLIAPGEIIDLLGFHHKTVEEKLQELVRGHPIAIANKTRRAAPPFIEILETLGATKGKAYRIQLVKAKISARDYHRAPQTIGRPEPTRRAPHETRPEDDAQGAAQRLIQQVAGALDVSRILTGRGSR